MRLPEKMPEGITGSFTYASKIRESHVSKAVHEQFLPKALAAGTRKAAPEALIIGTGLEQLQEAMERLKAGVTAQKIVVRLD